MIERNHSTYEECRMEQLKDNAKREQCQEPNLVQSEQNQRDTDSKLPNEFVLDELSKLPPDEARATWAQLHKRDEIDASSTSPNQRDRNSRVPNETVEKELRELSLEEQYAILAGNKRAKEIRSIFLPDWFLADFNAEFAVVTGGKAVGEIIRFSLDAESDPYQFIAEANLRRKWASRELLINGKVQNPVGPWLRDARRKEFTDIGMYPEGVAAPKGSLNLWPGFNVSAEKMRNIDRYSCDLFLAHMLDVICSGNKSHYKYLLDWSADMVQRPSELPGIAIVLRGKKGVGKSFFAEQLGTLFGKCFTSCEKEEDIIGTFNKTLENKILICLEEALWAGYKKGEAALKYIVTQKNVRINPKYIDAYEVKSYAHFIIVSNNEWVVPAGVDERRFCVLQASDVHRIEEKYFDAIDTQMNNGGREALLHLLLHRDLSEVSIRLDYPRTEALADQIPSTDPFYGWLRDWLSFGEISKAAFFDGQEIEWENNPVRLYPNLVFHAYTEYLPKWANSGDKTKFGARLKEFFGYEVLKKTHSKIDGRKYWAYHFPSLIEFRKLYEAKMNAPITWNNLD